MRLQPQRIWDMNSEELFKLFNSNVLAKGRIRFYAPSFAPYKTSFYGSQRDSFPTISITGNGCSLNCKHCGTLVLNSMYPVTKPKELFDLCENLKGQGASGCLISGGCSSDGSLPLSDFVDEIRKIKQKLGLTVMVHTGIIGLRTAEKLKNAGVDAALIDIIGSDETIREICNLSASVKDYADSLRALSQAHMSYVPHILVGLHYGKLRGEMQALRMISKFDPSALVVIAFMPIRRTEMEDIEPPQPFEIARVVATARAFFPRTPLVLGCMRPKGKHRVKTDILAIRAGVDGIAFPTSEAVKYAEAQGCEISFSPCCCAGIYSDIAVSEFSFGRIRRNS